MGLIFAELVRAIDAYQIEINLMLIICFYTGRFICDDGRLNRKGLILRECMYKVIRIKCPSLFTLSLLKIQNYLNLQNY